MGSDRADFRPDLEGLRGLLILLVVLFHAEVVGLAGGFVGVDVFLVLSGFFITGLLVREHEASDRLDLPLFYGRRALRILPAMLLVVLVTVALVSWLWAPIDRADILSSAQAVSLSAGNVEFARASVDYFSHGENPLLHTWSLAVEQQFYLVWPPLVLAIATLVRRRRATLDGDAPDALAKGLLIAFAVVGTASLALSLWLTRTAQPWAFFGLPTRLWEFAAGGALAVTIGRRTASVAIATLTQLVGLVAIGFAVATYDRATPYPGTAALLPALGGVALIAGGRSAPQSIVSRVLGARPLRWVGRLSFGWYLWHWPLVGLGAVIDPRIGVPGRLAWSAVALVLAWLTYHLLERSARDGNLARIPANWLPLGAVGASISAALIAHGALRVAQRTASRPEQAALAAVREDRMPHECWSTGSAPSGPCVFGDPTSSTMVVLFGDSHAEHWLGAVDRLGRERGWKVVLMVMGGCPVADLSASRLGGRARRSEACVRHRGDAVDRIVAMKPAAAILSSWDHYVPMHGKPTSSWQVAPEAWQDGLRRTYERLTAAKIPTVAVRGTPRTWFDVPACLSRRTAGLPFSPPCSYDRAASLSRVAAEAQTAAAKGLPVAFLDMNDQICSTPRCPVRKRGVVIFTDDNHLTASFSRSVAPAFGSRLDAALGTVGARLP